MGRLHRVIAPIGIVGFWILLVAGLGTAVAQGKIVIYAAEDEGTTNALMKAFTEETCLPSAGAR